MHIHVQQTVFRYGGIRNEYVETTEAGAAGIVYLITMEVVITDTVCAVSTVAGFNRIRSVPVVKVLLRRASGRKHQVRKAPPHSSHQIVHVRGDSLGQSSQRGLPVAAST